MLFLFVCVYVFKFVSLFSSTVFCVMLVMLVNRGERLAVLLRVSGVVPGQDLHHGPHLHPPLLLRSPEHEVRVLHQVGHGGERVESFPEAQ